MKITSFLLALATLFVINHAQADTSEAIDKITKEIKRLKGNNAIFDEIYSAASGDGEGFTYLHDKKTVQELIPLNDACDELITNSSVEFRLFVRVSFEDEAKGLSTKKTSAFERLSKYPPERFIDYIGSKAIFFVEPSVKTLSYFEKYDPLEFYPEFDDETFDFKSFFKAEAGDSEEAFKSTALCYVFTPFLAVIGFENTASRTFERLERTIRRANIQSLHDDLKNLQR